MRAARIAGGLRAVVPGGTSVCGTSRATVGPIQVSPGRIQASVVAIQVKRGKTDVFARLALVLPELGEELPELREGHLNWYEGGQAVAFKVHAGISLIFGAAKSSCACVVIPLMEPVFSGNSEAVAAPTSHLG